MTARTTIRAMTPIIIPKMEIAVMIEINPCFLFAFKYLREKNVSKDIEPKFLELKVIG
ncbi:unnamed protein product [marine sediment metagenome]|uniref:Uncharacterized protein n=1 Tax=marine sediment metagenome TaxID=412755 RepID=X0XWP4_9ZZZZ